MNWGEIKSVYCSFRRLYGEKVAAKQAFHRMVHWLYELMPKEEAREFMMAVVDPDPLIDWETGAELGDPCPLHPEHRLSGCVPTKEIHLTCSECWR